MSTAVLIPGPPSKRIKSECILCNDTCDEIRTFTQDQWEKFEQTALKWKALDKYGDVYDQIKWERGPTGPQSIFHRHCVSYMQTSKKLEQAKNRLKKRDAAPTPSLLNEADVSVQENPEESVSTAPRRSTRVSLGKIYDKTLCIWCMKPDEKLKKKKGGDKDSEFHRIEQNKPWRHFCASTPYYLDPLMRERILGLIAATPKDDPFAADIHYHKKCWDKYVSNPNRRRRHRAQNVTMEEATAVFILHIQNTVFDFNEPRTLQGLVLDYRDILFELGQEDKEPKTSSIKSLLMEEFGDSVGFHERYQKNKSTLVYDCSNGGSFLESAINSWGLSLEELLKNVARRINEQAKSLPQLQWPPTINEVSADTSENFLTLFVGWLKSPNDKEEKTSKSPHVYVIASLLQSLITKKRTNLQVLLTNLIYGLTRSRELVDITKKLGLGISYQDIKNLYSTWAKLDVEKGTCPPQIAEKFPAVVIMDNDDFKSDTNGTIIKSQKSKLLQSFSYVPMQFEELRNYAAIVDMGFIWRLCSPSPEDREKRDESAFTWRDYAVKIFGTVMSRHASATTIIFVNDPYDVEESIKAGEHARREAHQYVCGSKNVFIRPLEALPNKRNLSNFFTNKSNKIRLQEFLKTEFCRLSMSHGEKTLIYCVQRSCEDLKTKMRLSAYECHHQEADTNLFYVTHVLRQSGFTNAIVIDAEDTDVVVQSSLVVKEIDGYLGIRKKKSTFNCEQLCGPDLASVILQIHVLTGADATSGFFGRGKKTVINHALKNIEDTQKLLGDLGKSLVLTYEVYRNVMMFVIRYVYNDKKSFTLADSRSLIWKRMKKSTQRIPPDEDSLRLHIKRCNYVVHMCLNYKSPDPPPSPRYHGWELIDGECSPIRYEKPALPESMTQSAATETMENNENSDNDSEDDDDIIKASDDEDTDGNETEREYENSGDEY